MELPGKIAASEPLPEELPQPGFEASYAQYQELLAELDRIQDLDGRLYLLKRLFGLLDRMERGIYYPGGAA